MMPSNKVERFSAAGLCSLLVLIASKNKWGAESNDIVLASIPVILSLIVFAYDWLRLACGWSSYEELKQKRAESDHVDKIRIKIRDCENALNSPHLSDEHKHKLKETLYGLNEALLRDFSATDASSGQSGPKAA